MDGCTSWYKKTISRTLDFFFIFIADEIMFIFGEPLNITDDLHYTHEEIIASQKIMAYWTNFAKYR
jgi:hypothetical protein